MMASARRKVACGVSATEFRFNLALQERLTCLQIQVSEQRLALETTEWQLRMVRETLAERERYARGRSFT